MKDFTSFGNITLIYYIKTYNSNLSDNGDKGLLLAGGIRQAAQSTFCILEQQILLIN